MDIWGRTPGAARPKSGGGGGGRSSSGIVRQQPVANPTPWAPPSMPRQTPVQSTPQPVQRPTRAPTPVLPPQPEPSTPAAGPTATAPRPEAEGAPPAISGLLAAAGMRDPSEGFVELGQSSPLNPNLGRRTPPDAIRILSQLTHIY